jgi:hypothetical protein
VAEHEQWGITAEVALRSSLGDDAVGVVAERLGEDVEVWAREIGRRA